MKNKFRPGDRVFDYSFGWGTVEGITSTANHDDKLNMMVIFDSNIGMRYTKSGKLVNSKDCKYTLSFTEYKIKGFTKKKPLPEIESGTPIYVKDNVRTDGDWEVRIFSHWYNGHPMTFVKGKLGGTVQGWFDWKLENPYKNDE